MYFYKFSNGRNISITVGCQFAVLLRLLNSFEPFTPRGPWLIHSCPLYSKTNEKRRHQSVRPKSQQRLADAFGLPWKIRSFALRRKSRDEGVRVRLVVRERHWLGSRRECIKEGPRVLKRVLRAAVNRRPCNVEVRKSLWWEGQERRNGPYLGVRGYTIYVSRFRYSKSPRVLISTIFQICIHL